MRNVWDWAIERNHFLTATHIPQILNVEADAESREAETRTEWKLNDSIFSDMLKHFKFKPVIDLFASRINNQLPRFFSFRPDPEAEVINAFSVNWHSTLFYCLPPFSCIGRVIRKIINDYASGILVVPNWPSQFWYPTLFGILEKPVYVIKPDVYQLCLPNQLDTTHPLFRHLELMACKMCGKCSNNKTYQKMWSIYL